MEKIVKSEEIEEQKPEAKPQHEPLHLESRSLSLGYSNFALDLFQILNENSNS